MSLEQLKRQQIRAKINQLRPVIWDGQNKKLILIDQALLPEAIATISHETYQEVARSVQTMKVRGAPAIGAAAAFGMALAAHTLGPDVKNPKIFLELLVKAKNELDAARPTAVNLTWATRRMLSVAETVLRQTGEGGLAALPRILEEEAIALAEEDVKRNRDLGRHGSLLVPQKCSFMHHCNTGSFATVNYGTAIGVLYACFEDGKDIFVWVNETRPRLQGARLSSYELNHAGVKCKVVVEGAAAHLMSRNEVDCVIVGCDRVAANGDTANKIGTKTLAVLAKYYNVPVYVCCPTSTIDLNAENGSKIKIEERDRKELSHYRDQQILPNGVEVYNPAFDVTPARLVSAFITEHGTIRPPYKETLPKVKHQAEALVRQAQHARLIKALQGLGSSISTIAPPPPPRTGVSAASREPGPTLPTLPTHPASSQVKVETDTVKEEPIRTHSIAQG